MIVTWSGKKDKRRKGRKGTGWLNEGKSAGDKSPGGDKLPGRTKEEGRGKKCTMLSMYPEV
jgi:hypothetical protein